MAPPHPLRPLLGVALACIIAGLASVARAEDVQPAGQPATGDTRLRTAVKPLVAAGDFRAILRLADRERQANPESLAALEYRAYSLEHLGRRLEARKEYEELIRRSPDHVWGRTQLGSLLVELGRPAEATEHLEHAVALQPTAHQAWRELVDSLRTQRLYSTAVSRVGAALEAGVDAAWAQAQLGYLHWANHACDASRNAWRRAVAAGADAEDCRRGLALVEFDQRSLDPDAEVAAATVQRRTGGEPWRFRVGSLEVVTRVGAMLPRPLDRFLRRLPARYAEFLGTKGFGASRVLIHLSRTTEEHEVHRRRLFPQGPPGRAFMVRTPRQGTGRGFGRNWRPPDWDLDLYVAWSDSALRTGISHELAHAVLQAGSANLPTWLDEGLATYLEVTDEAAITEPGAARPRLDATLREGLAAGRTTSLDALCRTYGPWVGNGARLRYAHAWSLVSHLLAKDETAFRAMLIEFRARPRDALAVLRHAFGDLDALEADWKASLTDE